MSPLSPRIGENPGLRGVFNAHSAPAMVKIQAEAGFRVMQIGVMHICYVAGQAAARCRSRAGTVAGSLRTIDALNRFLPSKLGRRRHLFFPIAGIRSLLDLGRLHATFSGRISLSLLALIRM